MKLKKASQSIEEQEAAILQQWDNFTQKETDIKKQISYIEELKKMIVEE